MRLDRFLPEFAPFPMFGRDVTDQPLIHPCHMSLVSFMLQYERLRAGRHVPLREDIDPRNTRLALSSMVILEHRTNGDITFRVSGARLAERFNRDLHGSSIASLVSECFQGPVLCLCNAALETPASIILSIQERAIGHSSRLEIVLAPMRSALGAPRNRLVGLAWMEGARFHGNGGVDRAGIRAIGGSRIDLSSIALDPTRPAALRGAESGIGARAGGRSGERRPDLTVIDGNGAGNRIQEEARDRTPGSSVASLSSRRKTGPVLRVLDGGLSEDRDEGSLGTDRE
mgnify:FL=1